MQMLLATNNFDTMTWRELAMIVFKDKYPDVDFQKELEKPTVKITVPADLDSIKNNLAPQTSEDNAMSVSVAVKQAKDDSGNAEVEFEAEVDVEAEVADANLLMGLQAGKISETETEEEEEEEDEEAVNSKVKGV